MTSTALKAAIGAALYDAFAPAGHEFLKKRLNGPQKAEMTKTVELVKSGKLKSVKAGTLKEVQETFGLPNTPNEAQLTVILLGRPPVGGEKVKEASRAMNAAEKATQSKLADEIKGVGYLNYMRKKKAAKEAAPATTESTKAPATAPAKGQKKA